MPACGVSVERPGESGTEWISKAEFRDYAGRVLRRQNAVASELIFRLPEIEKQDPERYRRLLVAEDQLLDACGLLIESTRQRRRGGGLDSSARRKLPEQTVECDRQTRRLERMLEQKALDAEE